MKILFGLENPKKYLKIQGGITPRLRLCGTNQTQSVHQASVKVQVLTKRDNEEGCWGEARGWRPLPRSGKKKTTGYYYGLCKATLVKLPQRAGIILVIPSRFDTETQKSHRDMFWDVASDLMSRKGNISLKGPEGVRNYCNTINAFQLRGTTDVCKMEQRGRLSGCRKDLKDEKAFACESQGNQIKERRNTFALFMERDLVYTLGHLFLLNIPVHK